MGLAAESAEHKTIMIDATYLKAHRTASSLRVSSADQKTVRGLFSRRTGARTPDRPDQGRHEYEVARGRRRQWPADRVLHVGRAGQMEWLPPSLDGIAMCQGRGVQRHGQRRTAR
jgi:hypothetical protein